MLKVGVGQSNSVEEAVSMALKEAPKPKLTIVFASSDLDPNKVYEDVKKQIPTGHIIGGTTAGEFTHLNDKPQTGTVVVMCLESPALKVGVGVGENIANNPESAGKTAAEMAYKNIIKDPSLASFIFLGFMNSKNPNLLNINPFASIFIPDGLQGVEEGVLRGALSVMGRGARIVGGSTGDDLKFNQTFQFANGVYTNSVVNALICGLKLGVGMSHPYKPTDKGAVVTKCDGRVIYELNNKPAAEVLKELLGVDELTPEVLSINPFGVRTGDVYADYIIKSAMGANEDGSITCYAEVKKDSYLTIMTTDRETAINNFKKALQSAVEDAGNPKEIGAIIVFNCILRHLLKESLDISDTKIIKEMFGENVPVIGFNTYGEQGATPGGSMGHYNQTSTVLVISKETLSQ